MSKDLPAVLRAVPMVMVMGAIFLASNQTGESLSLPPLPGIDKLGHAIAYGILAASVIYALNRKSKERNPSLVILGTTLFCFCYGLSDELHQSFIPGRSSSGFDVLADVCGALIICFLWRSRFLKTEGTSMV